MGKPIEGEVEIFILFIEVIEFHSLIIYIRLFSIKANPNEFRVINAKAVQLQVSVCVTFCDDPEVSEREIPLVAELGLVNVDT